MPWVQNLTKLKFLINKSIKIILGILIVLLLFGNARLYFQPALVSVETQTINKDVYQQLNYLRSKLRKGEGRRMQRLFPEGFVFINVLYGLSWTELIEGLPKQHSLYREGIEEINWVLKELDKPSTKKIFNPKLPLEYGAFYKGWTNYLLGRKLVIESPDDRDSNQVKQFTKNCLEIKEALSHSTSPYLESYPKGTWPADVMTCVLSLKISDQTLGTKHEKLLANWKERVLQSLDPKTGLIPHSFDLEEMKTTTGARGSSQSLILTLLTDIDEELATNQYAIYKEQFQTYRIGLPGIREYPKGTSGTGDIDSGPVILDIGGAASIVGQRLAGKQGDWNLYDGLRNSIELYGGPISFNQKKKYIFGQLAMADAFIVWSHSMDKQSSAIEDRMTTNWRWKFQVGSLMILFVLLYAYYKL